MESTAAYRSIGPQYGKNYQDVRRNRCLVFTREAAAKIVGLRVAPLGVMVTHKVRIINEYSFDPSTARGGKRGLNRDTVSEEVPPCLCGEVLPALINVFTDLRIRFPNRRILLARAASRRRLGMSEWHLTKPKTIW